MNEKELMDKGIEILGWDEDGIKQLAKVTMGKLTTEVYVVPEFEEMSLEELKEYYERLEDKYDDLHNTEPDDEESEAHKDWEDKFEFIEELLEQVEEIIEERR